MPSEPTADTRPRHSTRLNDGRTARALDVNLRFGLKGIEISPIGLAPVPPLWPYDSLLANVPLSRKSREALLTTRLQSGPTLTIKDPAVLAEILARAPHLRVAATRFAGLKPGLAVGAVAFAIAGAVMYYDLSPSKGLASLMPEKARTTLGNSVLRSLPAEKQCAVDAGRIALAKLAQRLLPDDADAAKRIVVLDWNVLNAFAIPGGRVVLTRRIIQQATSADELAGVLAHEFGHGLELHPEAGLVRSVGFWALIQMLFTGTPGAIGNAGTLLAQLAYTRTSEREADDRAIAILENAKISAQPLATFFRRLDGSRPTGPVPRTPQFGTDVFSTHPNTAERIAKIEARPTYPSTPALDADDWQALMSICGDVPASADATRPIAERLKTATAEIERSPADAALHAARGRLHLDARQWNDAVTDFDRAIELTPRVAAYHIGRGNALSELTQFERAIADFTAALDVSTTSWVAHTGRGHALVGKGEVDAGLAELDTALALNSHYGLGYYYRALAFKQKGDWTAVAADADTAVVRAPQFAPARLLRGEAREQLNQTQLAIVDYRTVLHQAAAPSQSTYPDNPDQTRTTATDRLRALGVNPD